MNSEELLKMIMIMMMMIMAFFLNISDKKAACGGNDTILLHQSVMQMCGLTVGDLCVLNNTGVRRCLPCQALAPMIVGLSDRDLALFGAHGLLQIYKLLPSNIEIAVALEFTTGYVDTRVPTILHRDISPVMKFVQAVTLLQ